MPEFALPLSRILVWYRDWVQHNPNILVFRGQSKEYIIKFPLPNSPTTLITCPSLTPTLYRGVVEVDWTDWWKPRVLHRRGVSDWLLAKTTCFARLLDFWIHHLLSDPLTKNLVVELDQRTGGLGLKHGGFDWDREILVDENGTEVSQPLHSKPLEKFAGIIWSLGQHYGLPSFLLDVSFDPLMAITFALHNHEERLLAGQEITGVIYFFKVTELNDFLSSPIPSWLAPPPLRSLVDIRDIPLSVAKRPNEQSGGSIMMSAVPFLTLGVMGADIMGSQFFHYSLNSTSSEDKLVWEIYNAYKPRIAPSDDPFVPIVDRFITQTYVKDLINVLNSVSAKDYGEQNFRVYLTETGKKKTGKEFIDTTDKLMWPDQGGIVVEDRLTGHQWVLSFEEDIGERELGK